jgi:hypothetical protein
MNKDRLMHKAWKMLEAARPASGLRPETEAEWDVLLRAHEAFGYASFRFQGASEKAARALARAIHSGPAARVLLESAFQEGSHDHA